MTATVLIATHNRKKLAELKRLLGQASEVRLITLDEVAPYPEPVESGATFADNALIKAREGAIRTGFPTVADDSGLCVDALYGAPGVFSARWAGYHSDDEANLRLLLAQLSDVPDERRTAAFVCAAALVVPEPAGEPPRVEHVVEGRLTGSIIREPRGGAGFGYDPIFVPEGGVRTTAELSAAEKDAISHRGQAFHALAPKLAG